MLPETRHSFVPLDLEKGQTLTFFGVGQAFSNMATVRLIVGRNEGKGHYNRSANPQNDTVLDSAHEESV
ncbi:hypothetical protein L596_016458 [Steinernema carpocapsae]|uniref:Uncharacterized protein n=1 Tax=Steinernema carpocapsae TaxID=34508 RepID=A0A4U5NI21_STECR|nr:hypothetical protein L596_016458 [Steinernema carpocapsae]